MAATSSASPPKPHWLKVRTSLNTAYQETAALVQNLGLHTVCQEAACPNMGECWKKKHATVLILGDICTRSCRFCNIKTGVPKAPDPREPDNVAHLASSLGLAHIVITSVDRDDLPDGGAHHFAQVIHAVRAACPGITIEVLTPDFLHKEGALEQILSARPDVFNHNVETVPRLYSRVRPQARYFQSLYLLKHAKALDPSVFTKSGLMVGLGEESSEVRQVMNDLRAADVDFLTIGQYLQPTPQHHPIIRYAEPQEYEAWKRTAFKKGFLLVSASPFTRSSYHAGEDFAVLRKNRKERENLPVASV